MKFHTLSPEGGGTSQKKILMTLLTSWRHRRPFCSQTGTDEKHFSDLFSYEYFTLQYDSDDSDEEFSAKKKVKVANVVNNMI